MTSIEIFQNIVCLILFMIISCLILTLEKWCVASKWYFQLIKLESMVWFTFFLLLLSRNLQAKIWQNVMNTSIYIQYNTIQSRAAFSLLWLVAINSSLICTQCWHHLQTNASFSLFSMVVSISMFTPLMLADNADKICG